MVLVICFVVLFFIATLCYWFALSNMAGENDDFLQSIREQLNGKKLSILELCNEIFLKGKRMWGYVDGTFAKP